MMRNPHNPSCRTGNPCGVCVLCVHQLELFGRDECLTAPVRAWRAVQRASARRRG